MKTIFDIKTREELIKRIAALTEENRAGWGKMNVYQMITHCIVVEEMYLGKKKYTQSFLGRIFGRMALTSSLKDESPMKHNMPTLPEFKMTGNGTLGQEKEKWISLIHEYSHFSNDNFIHPFFGKMTREQVGYLEYKHVDHHLRQFNA